MKKKLFGALLASMSCASVAQVGITAGAGTTGISLHASTAIDSGLLNVRLGVNWLDYEHDFTANNTVYLADFRLRSFDALLDYFPVRGSFRLTGGLVYNGNKLDGRGQPSTGATFDIGGSVYTAAQVGSVNGSVEFRKIAPYLGIGWGNAAGQDKGWALSADLGVLLQGTPRTSVMVSRCTASELICSRLAEDLAAESAAVEDEVKRHKVFPVLRVGAIYRF